MLIKMRADYQGELLPGGHFWRQGEIHDTTEDQGMALVRDGRAEVVMEPPVALSEAKPRKR